MKVERRDACTAKLFESGGEAEDMQRIVTPCLGLLEGTSVRRDAVGRSSCARSLYRVAAYEIFFLIPKRGTERDRRRMERLKTCNVS